MQSHRNSAAARTAGPPGRVAWSPAVGLGGWLLAMAALLVVAPVVVGVVLVSGVDFDDVSAWLIPLAPVVTGVVALMVATNVSGGSARQLLGDGRVRLRALVAGALLGIASFGLFNILFGAAVVYVLQLLGMDTPEIQPTLRDAATRPETVPILVLSTMIAAPLGEELLYRGLLFQALLRRFRPSAAMGLSALAFAVGHITLGASVLSNVVLALLILPLGVVLAWSFYRWGTLWVPIVIHAVFNGITVALISYGMV